MVDADDVIERARNIGLHLQDVLNQDVVTLGDVKEAAAGLDGIEADIERLLADG